MPNLASGTFVQTEARTAMTAPDYGSNKSQVKQVGLLQVFCVKLYEDFSKCLTAPNEGQRRPLAVLHMQLTMVEITPENNHNKDEMYHFLTPKNVFSHSLFSQLLF